jgi:hypothetical protein
MSRESRLNAAFVTVVDTLTADYDVVELLHTPVTECTEILDAQAGDLMLAGSTGQLQVGASSRSASPPSLRWSPNSCRGRWTVAWSSSRPRGRFPSRGALDEAFLVLQAHARNHNHTLRTVAEGVANRTLDLIPEGATSAKPGPARQGQARLPVRRLEGLPLA